jgi:2-haloacid dehalogenase
VPIPRLVLLDVNETLSDLAPLADRFTDVGAPPALLPTWFAAVLRDGIAATAAGHHVAFADLAAADLALLLGREPGVHDLDEAVAHVLAGLDTLDVHPAAYRFALDRLGVPAADAAVVAGLPWDLDGAARVGLRTGWADRHGDRWPAPLSAPTVTGGDLASTVDALLAAA